MSTTRTRLRAGLALAAATAAAGSVLTACTTRQPDPPAPVGTTATPSAPLVTTAAPTPVDDPKALLDSAADDFAATDTVHFTLAGSDLPTKGSVLVAAEGDAARPDRLKATATTRSDGSQITTDVIAVGSRAWVQVPLIGTWIESDDARLDARMLWDDDTGVSALVRAVDPSPGAPSTPMSGRRVIDGTLPAAAVQGLIPSAGATGDVPVQVTIDTGVTAARVESVRLTVDLDGSRSTYVLALSNFGETITIDQP